MDDIEVPPGYIVLWDDPEDLGDLFPYMGEMARCGKRYKYAAKGCRCALCRSAQRAWQHEYYLRKGGNNNINPEKERAGYVRRRGERKAAGIPIRNYSPGVKAADARRRAAKLGTTTEKFTHAEIFERDEWTCGLCGEPVDRKIKFPDPQSPSLDHVVPLSKDGTHTRDNVQLAHLRCNVAKGDRN